MTRALAQPTTAHWSKDHRQDLADLVRDLRSTGDLAAARLAEQALAASKK